jgi:hypothetical protein
VTRVVAVAVPPGPVAVMVKVVELVGFTGVEPCTATLPTLGSMSASVASVEVHERVVESPLLIVEGDAESVTVGCAAAGAGAACVGGALATCFLQPPMNAKTEATPNKSVNFRIVPACICFLLPRFPGFLAETAGIFRAVAFPWFFLVLQQVKNRYAAGLDEFARDPRANPTHQLATFI